MASETGLFTSAILSPTTEPSGSLNTGIPEPSNSTPAVPESIPGPNTERSGTSNSVAPTPSLESITSSSLEILRSSTELGETTSTTIAPPEQAESTLSLSVEVPSSTSDLPSNTEVPKQSEVAGVTSTPLSGGAIAGIVIGVVIILMALAAAGAYLVSRRRRKYASPKDESSGQPRISSRGVVGSKRENYYQDEENTKTGTVPPVQEFDAPLDDLGLVKLFDRLDDRISDHLVNFNLDENIGSPEFAEHLNSGGPKAAGEGIIYRGKGLLKREDSRLYTLRALFAYHVFGAIADQIIFTEEQHKWIHQAARSDRPVRCATICRQLESEGNFTQVVDFLYHHLESKTQIHVPRNMLASENRLASLREIAKGAALVTIRLGLQRDNFKLVFLFQSKHYAQARRKIPCETSAIKDFDVNPEYFEILGEAGSGRVVRAMVSPSVYRCPDGAQKYMVRKMKVFTTPGKSSK